MAQATKNLAAVDDAITMRNDTENGGTITIQYPSTGAGTLVLEGTLNDTDWVSIMVQNVTTKTDSATMAAAGIYYAEGVGFNQVRVRKSVGAAANLAVMNIEYN